MSLAYFNIAGITLEINSELPVTAATFSPKFLSFTGKGEGKNRVQLHHHFSRHSGLIPQSARQVWREGPWIIYDCVDHWIYHWEIVTTRWSRDFSHGELYHRNSQPWESGNMDSLAGYTTDQIFLAPILANHQAAIFHSTAFQIGNRGIICIGHSEAGKSTLTTQMMPHCEVLCDDRNIIRQHGDGFKVYGTWSHGDIPVVNPGGGELAAICFLKQASANRLVPMNDPKAATLLLVESVIRAYAPKEWWEKVLDLSAQVVQSVPCYTLEFDLSGGIVPVLTELMAP